MELSINMFVLLLIAAFVASCAVKDEMMLDSRRVIVSPGCEYPKRSQTQSGNMYYGYFRCGEIGITIRDHELMVNNVSYSVLAYGDAVMADNGIVYINDNEQHGTLMTYQQVLTSTSEVEYLLC